MKNLQLCPTESVFSCFPTVISFQLDDFHLFKITQNKCGGTERVYQVINITVNICLQVLRMGFIGIYSRFFP